MKPQQLSKNYWEQENEFSENFPAENFLAAGMGQ